MESYNPYLIPHKVLNAPEHYCISNGLPKSAKSHFVLVRCLGINPKRSYSFLHLKIFKIHYKIQFGKKIEVDVEMKVVDFEI